MACGIGILGFAHGHVGAYLGQWRSHPEWGVAAVAGWDHDAERNSRTCTQAGLQPVERAEDLVRRTDVHTVLITAETAFHANLVEMAAAAGKAVILQKPIALTLAEADRIVEAVKANATRFTMAWQMRVDPQNLKIRELMTSGTLGRIFMVRRRHGLGMCLNPAFASSWHVDPAMNRDIWADDTAHALDFLYWLLGMPESVTAEILSLHDPRMPMDNGVALLRYPGGPLAEVTCSFTNHAGENTTEVIGDKGSLVQNFGDGPSCNVPKPEGGIALKWYLAGDKAWTVSELSAPASHGARIAGLARPLAEFAKGERGPIATAEEGRDVLRLVLACYVSTREGRRVAVDDPAIALV
ncbi:MAG: Gfo/Idh/MocA family oxidoreductase [Lentisphaeria bacterium]|nr:Gfo/Idh/MocA family oxidoreductase [Lentisphaeria bacterium]